MAKPRNTKKSRERTEPPAEERQRFAAADEPFWTKQEARLAGQLGQPCCTLSGMCTLLGAMEGSFAVIIHGERDCGNSFVSHRAAATERFFCTNVTELQATTGRVDEPLEQCLRLVLEELQPDVVLVLGTCLVSMIGADTQAVVDRVSAETDAVLLHLRTSGLRLSSQAAMVDWLYESLAGLPQLPPAQIAWRRETLEAMRETARTMLADPQFTPARVREIIDRATRVDDVGDVRTINLIGLPSVGSHDRELGEVLPAAGIRVAGLYPFEADLDAWRRISHAELNVVADRRLYPKLLARLERDFTTPTLEVPLPVGLGQTLRFYRRIGEALGLTDALDEVLAERVAEVRERVEAFRGRARGLRVAMGVRMLNNYQVDQLAYEGLGDVEALAELGFDVTLLIQGPPEERPRFQQMLDRLECALPFHVFPSPWNLAPLLAEGDYQVAYIADHSAEEAHKAGVPMIKSRELKPLLEGVAPNLNVLEALLHAGDGRRGGGA